MAGHVQCYVDVVRQYADGHELMVEQQVPIGHITSEAAATGTSDAIVITADGEELIVIDLKFGRGVSVVADNNEQGQMYALGALELVSVLGYEPKRVRIVIHQPRKDTKPSEWACTVEELQAFAENAKRHAYHALQVLHNEVEGAVIHHLNPGEKQCKFCKAKADCPKLRDHVLTTVADDFVDIEQPIKPQITHCLEATVDNLTLGNLLASVDLIEDWCKAIRAKGEAEIFAGHVVPGYKLVQGKRGNRAWSSEAEAEAAMKAMRLKTDEMYTFKVISPTNADKLLKESPRRWTKLQDLIVQCEGKPTVVPESDKRLALSVAPTADEFENVELESLV
jgi:hypothetical protein